MPHLPTRNRSYNTNLNYAPSHLATNLPSTSTTPPHQPPPNQRTRLRLKQTAVKEQKSTGQARSGTSRTPPPPPRSPQPYLPKPRAQAAQTHEETRAPLPRSRKATRTQSHRAAPQRRTICSLHFQNGAIASAPTWRNNHHSVSSSSAAGRSAENSTALPLARSLVSSSPSKPSRSLPSERASEALPAEKAD